MSKIPYRQNTPDQLDRNRKATVKFKRIKTLAKKGLQLADHSNVMVNILVFNVKSKRLIENFTDNQVSLESMISLKQVKSSKRNALKITSKNIREMREMVESQEDED